MSRKNVFIAGKLFSICRLKRVDGINNTSYGNKLPIKIRKEINLNAFARFTKSAFETFAEVNAEIRLSVLSV